MVRDDTVAVVGAGVIGAAVAYALTREGRGVLLLDRAEPGLAGASFGNAGHIAPELVEPLPSWGLLFGFWRELFAFGGVLDIPLRRAPEFLPWARRFAAAARHRTENTRHWRRWLSRPWARWRAGLPKSADPSCCGQMGIFKSGSDLAPTSGRPSRGSPWSAWEFRRRRCRTRSCKS